MSSMPTICDLDGWERSRCRYEEKDQTKGVQKETKTQSPTKKMYFFKLISEQALNDLSFIIG